MTLSSEINTISHTGNGSTTVFAYNFRVDEASHMKVYVDGVLQASGYSIDGLTNPSGGNVTFDTAPANGLLVVFLREVPFTQETDYTPYAPFPAETHEQTLDNIVMQTQQLAEKTDRAITAPPGSDPNVDYTLPLYDAGKGIMWSESDPKQLVTSDDGLNNIVSDAQAARDAAQVAQTGAETAQTGAESAETTAGNHATNAGASASFAAAAATNAQNFQDKAEEWAQNPEDTPVETGPDQYSALHWAAKALLNSDPSNTARDWPTAQRYTERSRSVTGTTTIDLSDENNVELTLTGDTTIDVSNMSSGRGCLLRIIQDATGGHTPGFSANFTLADYDISVNDTALKTTIFLIYTDGTTCFLRKWFQEA